MEHYVYLRERRRGARRVKTPYQAIRLWAFASGAIRETVQGKGLTTEAWRLPESYLNTDSSPAYTEAGKRFQEHRTVEHAKTLIGPNGENNNQAEELNWRYDRAEKGIYLNIEPKYMLDYAAEIAFRSDTRRLPNGQQLRLAMNVALNVGPSMFWRGFTRGQHRTVELVHPLPLPSKASGPPKGRHPVAAVNGRVPR